MGAEPLHRTAYAFIGLGGGVGASHQLPIERSIEQDRVVEQIRHLIRGTDEAVKQPGEPEGAAPDDTDRRLARPRGRVDEADELPRRRRIRPRDMNRASVGGRCADQLQHRLRRVVDKDELMGSVRIERPSARFARERSLEYGPEEFVHHPGTVEVRIPRKDEPDSPVAVGLQEPLLNGQPEVPLLRVRLLRMIFRDGPRLREAVDVHVAGECEYGARGFRRREGVLREPRDKTRPLRIRSVRGMDDDLGAAGCLDDRFLGEEIPLDDLRAGREPAGPGRWANDGPDLEAGEAGATNDGPADRTPRSEDNDSHARPTSQPTIRLTEPPT